MGQSWHWTQLIDVISWPAGTVSGSYHRYTTPFGAMSCLNSQVLGLYHMVRPLQGVSGHLLMLRGSFKCIMEVIVMVI